MWEYCCCFYTTSHIFHITLLFNSGIVKPVGKVMAKTGNVLKEFYLAVKNI